MEKHSLEGTLAGYLVQIPAQSKAVFEGRCGLLRAVSS